MSLRYSIYKVQCSLFRCRSQLFHSSTFKLICQELFQVFSNLFEVFRFACCSLSNFAMLAHPIGIVKNFFHILSNFFRICHSIAPPAGDSHILAHASAFVKQHFSFFHLFLPFFFPSFASSFTNRLLRIPLPAGVGIR